MPHFLILQLTQTAVDHFLTDTLPYASMISLAAILKELSLEDPTRAWAKQPLPSTVWHVVNEELCAKI